METYGCECHIEKQECAGHVQNCLFNQLKWSGDIEKQECAGHVQNCLLNQLKGAKGRQKKRKSRRTFRMGGKGQMTEVLMMWCRRCTGRLAICSMWVMQWQCRGQWWPSFITPSPQMISLGTSGVLLVPLSGTNLSVLRPR